MGFNRIERKDEPRTGVAVQLPDLLESQGHLSTVTMTIVARGLRDHPAGYISELFPWPFSAVRKRS